MSQLSKLEDISNSIKAWAIQTEPTNTKNFNFVAQQQQQKTILKANTAIK